MIHDVILAAQNVGVRQLGRRKQTQSSVQKYFWWEEQAKNMVVKSL